MFIRTPHLLLRPHWIEDASALARFARSFDEDAMAGVPEDESQGAPLPDLLVWLRTNQLALAGRAGLYRTAAGEIGFHLSIAPGLRRRGYGREAGQALIELARFGLGLPGLVATPGNAAGAHLLGQLGFTPAPDSPDYHLSFDEKGTDHMTFTLAA